MDYAGLAAQRGQAEVPLERDDLIRELIDIQYDRNDYDLVRGTFRVRGDTVDVFPPYAENPLRISFFGDEVELIAEVDNTTGEVVREFDAIPIWPASHYVTDAARRWTTRLKTISEELERPSCGSSRQKRHAPGGPAPRACARATTWRCWRPWAFATASRTTRATSTAARPASRPTRSSTTSPRTSSASSTSPTSPCPRSAACTRATARARSPSSSTASACPAALDNRPLRFDEFEARIPQFIYVSATPGDYEESVSAAAGRADHPPDGASWTRTSAVRRRAAGRSTTSSTEMKERVASEGARARHHAHQEDGRGPDGPPAGRRA